MQEGEMTVPAGSQSDHIGTPYETERHACSGEPGRVGHGATDLCMDHIHGGPIVGPIWGWENMALSKNVCANWSRFQETARAHLACAAIDSALEHETEGFAASRAA
jgi:hypothetical protein